MTQQSLFDETTDTNWKDFRDSMKKESEERRVHNLNNSLRILAEEGINFVSSNGGVHSVIEDHGQFWDFWPSTGKWAKRGPLASYKRGVFNLIKDIEDNRPK